MTSRHTKILIAHYKKALKENNPYIKYAISEEDVSEWTIMIHNMDEPYKGGEYIFTMKAPDDFPFKPPEFVALTPNGFYDVGGKICISVGEFHPERYRATLGMSGFASQVMAGMIAHNEMGEGIRLIETTNEEKKELAEKSIEYNLKYYKKITTLFT